MVNIFGKFVVNQESVFVKKKNLFQLFIKLIYIIQLLFVIQIIIVK